MEKGVIKEMVDLVPLKVYPFSTNRTTIIILNKPCHTKRNR